MHGGSSRWAEKTKGGQKTGTEEDGRQNEPFTISLISDSTLMINNRTNSKVLKINGIYGSIHFTVDATYLRLFSGNNKICMVVLDHSSD